MSPRSPPAVGLLLASGSAPGAPPRSRDGARTGRPGAALVSCVYRYGLTGRELWLPSSLLFVVLFWGMNLVSERMDAERRAIVAGLQRGARARLEVPAAFLWVPMHVVLILVVLGLFPDVEAALYITAVVLYLFMDGLILLYLVHSQGRPATA